MSTSEFERVILIYIKNEIQGSEHLLDVMKKTEDINSFDYTKMIKDFETSTRHEEHLKKIRKKWASVSKKYQETIDHMKELREETYKHKNAELIKKLKKKEQTLITSLENKQKDKMKDKEKAIALLMEKEKTAKENVEKFKEEQEKIRLQLERDTHQKSKKNIFNLFF